MENSIIRKPSAMIQTNVSKLTATQRKMINFLVFFAQDKGDEKYYYTTLQKLKKSCGILNTKTFNLKEQFKALRDISIEFNYLKKDKRIVWKSMNVIAAVEISNTTGEIKFEIPYMLKEIILDPKIYAPLNVLLIAGFKSKYSIVLYELLRDYINAPKFPELSIFDLKNLLSVDLKKYKNFYDFKKRVLNIAVNEINKKTDITCSYELIKSEGNKYSHIQFKIEKDIKNVLKIVSENTIDVSKNISLLSESLSLNNNKKNELKEKIPDEILRNLEIENQTISVFKIIIKNLHLGEENILANLEYVYNQPNVKEFNPYLRTALKENYGSELLEKKIKFEKKEKIKAKNLEKLLKEKRETADFEILKERFEQHIKNQINSRLEKSSEIEKDILIEKFKDTLKVDFFIKIFEKNGVNDNRINSLYLNFLKKEFVLEVDKQFALLCKSHKLEVKKTFQGFILVK